MENYRENIAEKLNKILELTYDEEQEFGKAAEECTAPTLSTWLNERALDRRRFAEQLKWEVRNLGGDYEEKGTLNGDVQRAWMDIRAFFSKDNDEAMLDEIIKSEKSTLKKYRDILEESDIPPSVAAMLSAHMAQIEYGIVVLTGIKEVEFNRE